MGDAQEADRPARGDRYETLDWAERWFSDGFHVVERPGGSLGIDVDMTRAAALLERLRAGAVRATYTHVLVRATALALARHPAIHVLVAGTRRLRPDAIDIGLSVAGETMYSPVMVIEDAGRKTLPALAAEIRRREPEVRALEASDLARLRRWGWLVPFRSWRRALLRWLSDRVALRRRLTGTFQVTCVASVDRVVPLVVNAVAVLGAGRVRDRVVAVAGAAVVRPTVTLMCSFDHKVWDGARAATFLDEVRRILEEGTLDAEEATAPR